MSGNTLAKCSFAYPYFFVAVGVPFPNTFVALLLEAVVYLRGINTKEKSMKMYHLTASYPAKIFFEEDSSAEDHLERRIERAVAKIAPSKRYADDTSMGFSAGAGRDLGWSFRSEAQALLALAAVRRFKGVKAEVNADEDEDDLN